ncbi:MAG: hypothetical protein JW724_07425 [Candidatus Altiarchaeota archaeon]|nr:hypothetical protein [Candidatus Altiarchaeota archaeon]
MGLKKIFGNGFGFLFFDLRFFAVVLLFYLFMRLAYMSLLPTSAQVTDIDLGVFALKGLINAFFGAFMLAFIIKGARAYIKGRKKTGFTSETLKRNFMPLLTFELLIFVLSFIGSVIAIQSMEHAQADEGMADAFLLMTAGFFFNLLLLFLLMLAPAAIVLEKETFIGGVKRALDILRKKPLDYVIFSIVLYVFFGFLFTLPLQIEMLFLMLNQTEISIPGMDYLLMVFNAAWFVFYTACLTGFYMERSNRSNQRPQPVAQA